MQIDVQSKSKSLLGVGDLTLVATIRRGLIPALDSRSYESRLRLLMRTLNTLRISSLEAEPTPLLADAVDRIRAIHSFRLAIVGQEQKQLLLAVAFDGGWEAYMRRIWRDLGPLLDVIFCNCEGYLISHDHSYAAYAGWVRSAQVGTEFFYNASPATVNDLHYLRENERRRIDHGARPQPGGDLFEQALPALTALYRLTDMYPPEPGLADGACLLRAARHLLRDLVDFAGQHPLPAGRTPTERAALRWFAGAVGGAPPAPAAPAAWDPRKVQCGIVEPYGGATHGCLLLVGLKDAAAAHALLAYVGAQMLGASDQDAARSWVNLGLTVQGLQVAGVPDGTLEQLPQEFREGMAARAGVLGDLHHNHPTRWTLPERNWPPPGAGARERVELSSVHAIVQYTCSDQPTLEWQELVGNARHPLAPMIDEFERSLAGKGVRILSVQAMQRFVQAADDPSRDHFGFVDGISQPTLGRGRPGNGYADDVAPGDLFLGYENSLGDPPLTGRLWNDSTFVVIRKLRQDVQALDAALRRSPLNADEVKARLMGRTVDGRNLIDGTTGNDFDYSGDPDGTTCPLQSHVRRANPRSRRPDMPAVPRIMRRGMSFGPRPAADPGAERGLVFMAYNASIAEQYEVIQSWLNGGNSGGPHTYSALRDPLLGVAQDGDPRTFVYTDAHGEQRVDLTSDRPFVKLEWGVYAFVPSLPALAELQAIALEAAHVAAHTSAADAKKKEDQRTMRLAVQAQIGAAVIARLRRVEQALGFEAATAQWKIALEDVGARMSGISQAIWTAVRQLHGGALRTPYGVLVCSKSLVMEVFDNRGRLYTATGYAERMRQSFGEIYLGMDDGQRYRDESRGVNEAIQSVRVRDGFVSAYDHTRSTVGRLVEALQPDEDITVDVKDIVDEVLAGVSAEWFGLPDGGDVVAGGWHWRSDPPPTCPGHFQSPSRYMFQPNPGREASATGQAHGKALHTAVRAFVASHRTLGTAPSAPLGRALFDAIPGDDDRLARTLIGVMMGFLPTVDGNLRGALYEWVSDRSLWDHRIEYLADADAIPFARARRVLLPPLRRTLQLRPVPELAWRIALARHHLGPVVVEPGDKIAVSIVSAMQECLANDDRDLFPVFGGDRSQPQHPTHACPGYKMALGVMLGTLAGLLESATLRPTMSPMALRLGRRG